MRDEGFPLAHLGFIKTRQHLITGPAVNCTRGLAIDVTVSVLRPEAAERWASFMMEHLSFFPWYLLV